MANNTFFTQVISVDGRPLKVDVNPYSGCRDVRCMADAASRESMEHTEKSGEVAIVDVATRRTVKRFEVEVTHQVTTKLKILKRERIVK